MRNIISNMAIKTLLKEQMKKGYNGMYCTLNPKQVEFWSKHYKLTHIKAMQYRFEWSDEENKYINEC